MIIGTGVDVVEIPRIRRITEKPADRFIHRVFTPSEQQYCRAHRDPAPHFAARFAAKEALFKALGTGWAQGVAWQNAEVLREGQEAPILVLHGEALRFSEAMGTKKIHLSLSHADSYAIAMVILEG
jgi:holo-[acyl-carrier protein] synthase